MSECTRLGHKVGLVGLATLLSRILGFCRDMAIAVLFGAGLCSDAFLVAFRLPNLFRKLFAEGALSLSFIPAFSEIYSRRGRAEAFEMARAAIWFLGHIVTALILVGIIFAEYLVHVLAPGFGVATAKFALTVTLTRIMLPYALFICTVALCMGILNTLDHFTAPAFAPLVFNIAMLAALLGGACFISQKTDQAILLAVGVLLGGMLQLGLQIPILIKKGVWQWHKRPPFHPSLKKVGAQLVPSAIGAGAYQINTLAAILLASTLREGSVTYLYFADRLIQFPLGIFVLSISTVILPTLANQATQNDLGAVARTFSDALRAVILITLPAMVGLIILRKPIIALLFQYGDFDLTATRLTAQALYFFGIGLWAFAGTRIVVAVFFALQDFKTPAKAAFLSIALNLILGGLLMRTYAHGGLALAVSLSACIQLAVLLIFLDRRLEGLVWRTVIISLLKTIACSALMGLAVWCVAFYIIPLSHYSGGYFLLLQVLVSIMVGTFLYGLMAYGANSADLRFLGVFKAKGKA